jgi:hypothetical protein
MTDEPVPAQVPPTGNHMTLAQYDEMHSSPVGWMDTAEALLRSADVVAADENKRTDRGEWGRGLGAGRAWAVAAMLRGMAVEVLLKALWAHRGNPLVVKGVVRVHGVGHHKLLALAVKVCDGVEGIELTDELRRALQTLEPIVFYGRYPIPRSVDESDLVVPMSFHWGTDLDFVIDKFIDELRRALPTIKWQSSPDPSEPSASGPVSGWTTTAPAANGFYWCRQPDHGEPKVVAVSQGHAVFGENHVPLSDCAGLLWWGEALVPPEA